MRNDPLMLKLISIKATHQTLDSRVKLVAFHRLIYHGHLIWDVSKPELCLFPAMFFSAHISACALPLMSRVGVDHDGP